jgi:glycosyltransferase involved in cell wall biosynthesis
MVSIIRAKEKAKDIKSDRQIADAARDNGNWSLAARHYGKMLTENPADAGIWLQRGHMLKELGLFVDARKSYDNALELSPSDPEIHLQLAHLAKVRGKFDEAVVQLLEAKKFGYQPIEYIEFQLKLTKTRNSPQSLRSKSQGRIPLKVYLSSSFNAAPSEDGEQLRPVLGVAHYSYLFSMRGYISALELLKIPYQVLSNPEYISHVGKISNADTNIHIGFYPPENARFLKGAYNIVCLAWEFSRLKTLEETPSYHVFSDAVRLLNRADKIWTTSSFGKSALLNSGVSSVEIVPSPIIATSSFVKREGLPNWFDLEQMGAKLEHVYFSPLCIPHPILGNGMVVAAQERKNNFLTLIYNSAEQEPPIVFLSIFNVHDYRKQIRPLIEAFLQFQQTHQNSYLILKLTIFNQKTEDISKFIEDSQVHDPSDRHPPLISDRIWLTSAVLTRGELDALYDCAAYYICTSHAEGQNLPILEAMARGVVPVTVNHTAMADYIGDHNSIVIASEERPLTRRLSQRYGMYGLSTYYVNASDVVSAMERAVELDNESYSDLSKHASDTALKRFDASIVKNALDQIVGPQNSNVSGERV